MSKKLFTLILLTMVFLSACGSAGSGSEPPPAKLTINGQTQVAGVGTYCWQETKLSGQGTGVCADMIGIPTPATPLPARVGAEAELELPISDDPAGLFVTVVPVTADGTMENDFDENSWWQYQEGETVEVQLTSRQNFALDFEPGLYLITVQARWDGLGDVIYGFLVELN